jgi:4-amino-4-deoxy-L-arabinose transferase-like glycosyltransferase
MESAGVSYLRGIDRNFYLMAPMGMVLQAGAFKAFGFKLLVQRELSVVCGLGAVLLWYLVLRRLVANRIAALAAILLSLDLPFLSLSSLGRSDMISLFFSMAALAGYMHWRERSLALALAVANTACALSGMVHPNGGIVAVASLAVLVLYLDRTRLRWNHLVVIAACYGVLGLGWGLYIAQAPDLFVAQFFGNVANRLGGPMALTRMVKGEVSRYFPGYEIRSLLRVSYLCSVVFCAFSKELRRRSAILLMMFAAIALTLFFLEGSKQGWYLVHLSPLFCAFLALSSSYLWKSGRIMMRIIPTVQVVIVLLGVASIVYPASKRNLQRLYMPTVAYLDAHTEPGDVVFARSEFYFGLSCRTCLRDDENLGAFSGLRAKYIVLDPDYAAHLAELREKNPVVYREIEQRLKTEYQEVFRNANYQVLRRSTAGL